MGITGLLPFLEKATRPCHVSEFRGGTVAVDSYCFLHKGANSCAEQLAYGNEDNQMYVQYCLKYVKMLLSYDIHPIMVFDGRNLPAKAETEAKRRESRKKARQKAAELLRLGKRNEAHKYFKQCIDITPKMANNLIKGCHKLNVDCIVAPYESDAQMAFFNLKGIAECVITEDSDLVLFGCKKVLFKLDLNGAGRLVESEKIYMTMKMRPDQYTFEKFRFMCILSGCDYVSSLSGIGLKKAEKFFKTTAETNPEIFLDRIPRYLNMHHLEITEEYKKNVLIANATFQHQTVYDPYKKKLVHLTDPDITGINPEYLINSGEKFDNEKAYQVALGNLNPYNFQAFDNWNPSDVSQFSIWSRVYRKRISRKELNKIEKSTKSLQLSEDTAVTLFKIDEEQQVVEEDNQIENDLSVYTKKLGGEINNIENKAKVEEAEDESTTKLEISPIIRHNPFSKRLSKFPRTYTCGNTTVVSRFFHSESIKKIDIESSQVSDCDIKIDIIKNESFEMQTIDKSSESSEDYKHSTNLSVEVKTTLVYSNSEEVLKSSENTSELPPKKRNLEDAMIKDVQDNKKLVQVGEVLDLVEIKEEVSTVSGNTTEIQNLSKRRKLGPCRTVGLNKSIPKQQTLHNFFANLKQTK